MTQISSARRDIHARMVTVALATIALVGSFLVAGEAVATTECGADSNPIVCENSKRGTDPEVWDIAGAGDPSIQGFSTDISVNVGARIDFKIDTDAPEYTIDIYRTGWYQDRALRLRHVERLRLVERADDRGIRGLCGAAHPHLRRRRPALG
jgi:hypothetical protein